MRARCFGFAVPRLAVCIEFATVSPSQSGDSHNYKRVCVTSLAFCLSTFAGDKLLICLQGSALCRKGYTSEQSELKQCNFDHASSCLHTCVLRAKKLAELHSNQLLASAGWPLLQLEYGSISSPASCIKAESLCCKCSSIPGITPGHNSKA